MPERDPAIAPPSPFNHGVFLLHLNKGREAYEEGRYGEARKELESAQKLRPNEPDVLNLLGLVYFKTNAFPEAEVIYRRLVRENPDVFTLLSNLGLILYKQGKLDEAEQFLLRAIELRRNYARSHLYLGLLYKQRKRFGSALEHLRFAGADKLVREVESEMRAAVTPPPQSPSGRKFTTQKMKAVRPVDPDDTLRVPPPKATRSSEQPTLVERLPDAPRDGQTAARKLQEAVDSSSPGEERKLDLKGRVEGASRNFLLHPNGFLEVNFSRSVYVKRGTVSSYSGNLKFDAETGLLGTTAQGMVKATGQGKVFLFEKGRKAFLIDLNEEFVYVEGSNLLALEETLTYRVEPIYDTAYQRKIDTVKIFGKGSMALSTSIEPLTLRVTPDYPLSISSDALVAWSGSVVPSVVDDRSMESVMITSEKSGFQLRFEGEGVVISES